MLQRELGPDVELVAAADELAREVAETLRRKGWGNEADRRGDYTFLSTGDPDEFATLATRFLQHPVARGRDRAGRGARLSRRAATASLPGDAPGQRGCRVGRPARRGRTRAEADGPPGARAARGWRVPRRGARSRDGPRVRTPCFHRACRYQRRMVLTDGMSAMSCRWRSRRSSDDAGRATRRPRHDARARPAGTSRCRSPATRARVAALCRVRRRNRSRCASSA